MDGKTMVVCIVAALCITSLVAAPVGCAVHRQQVLADALEKNPQADPISIKCALEGSTGGSSDTICLIKAAQPSGGKP